MHEKIPKFKFHKDKNASYVTVEGKNEIILITDIYKEVIVLCVHATCLGCIGHVYILSSNHHIIYFQEEKEKEENDTDVVW